MDLSILKKVILAVQILAFCAQIVGFASPYWATTQGNSAIHVGLWQICRDLDGQGTKLPNWYYAVQGLQSIGFALTFAVITVTAVFMYLSQTDTKRGIALASVIMSILAGITIISGIGVFGDKLEKIVQISGQVKATGQFSWAFGVTISSSVLSFVAALLMLILLIKSREMVTTVWSQQPTLN